MADERITIVAVEAESFHRLRVARVEHVPAKGVVRVTGANAAGKTSLLRAIKAALGGAGEVLGEAVIHDGSEDGTGLVRLQLSNGYRVERRFTESAPKGYLTVTGPDDGRHQQGKLSGWLGARSFDPLALFDLQPGKLQDTLLGLGADPELGTKLADLKAERARLYAERTPWISTVQTVQRMTKPEGERPDPIDTSAEMARLRELQAQERERGDAERDLQSAEQGFTQAMMAVQDAKDEVAELERRLQVARAQVESCQEDVVAASERIDERREALTALPDPSAELEAVQERLDNASEVERALRPWEQWDDAQAARIEAEAARDAITAQMDQLDVQRKELVAEAGIPVPGLSFSEDGEPLLNGRPLSVASGAERIRMAVHVALAADPELGICLVDEANDIDLEGLEELRTLAEEHDFQIWLARIGLEGRGEVVVEDGVALDRDAVTEEVA